VDNIFGKLLVQQVPTGRKQDICIKEYCSRGNPCYLFLVLFAIGFFPEMPVVIQGGIFV
jgi:hypothetical protein